MSIPVKKLKNGFSLPFYGLGLWQMGGGNWQADNSNDTVDIEAIQMALDAGVTHIDTAEGYGAGHSEELLAKAIEGYDRSKLFIATKVSGAHQSYGDLQKACHGSLNRLKTNYIDLYILHTYPKPGIDIKGTMRAMDELVSEGVVKYIGVSNLTPSRFKEAQKHTKNKIVCNQVHYNLQYREAEKRGVLEHAQENDVMIVAWRPVQQGMLPKSRLISEIAKKYQKTPVQIAINWLVSQDNVVTISKTSSPKHLKENLGALDWKMEKDDVERIRLEFPSQQTVSDSVPLNYPADKEP